MKYSRYGKNGWKIIVCVVVIAAFIGTVIIIAARMLMSRNEPQEIEYLDEADNISNYSSTGLATSDANSDLNSDMNSDMDTTHPVPQITIDSNGKLYYNDHHYMLYDRNDYGIDDYASMVDFCADLDGHLAVIDTDEENQVLYQFVLSCGLTMAYFGYSDEDQEGAWKWVTNDSNGYTNWAQGQPNNGANNKDYRAENYAHFAKDGNGTWNDAPFGANTAHFICEWEY